MRVLPVFVVLASNFSTGVTAAEPVPIAEVIEAFKAEFRIAQNDAGLGCLLRIERAEFRFDVARHDVFDGSLGKEVEVFGVTVGARRAVTERTGDDSSITIVFRPATDVGNEMFQVSGRVPGFAELIVHTKSEIVRASESDPPLDVEEVSITAGFSLERVGESEVAIAIVEGGQEEQQRAAHRVVLTLKPARDGSC